MLGLILIAESVLAIFLLGVLIIAITLAAKYGAPVNVLALISDSLARRLRGRRGVG